LAIHRSELLHERRLVASEHSQGQTLRVTKKALLHVSHAGRAHRLTRHEGEKLAHGDRICWQYPALADARDRRCEARLERRVGVFSQVGVLTLDLDAIEVPPVRAV